MVTEMLDVNDAKKILYELLQDLGWEEGQSIAMDTTIFDQSMINQTMMTTADVNMTGAVKRQFASEADKQLRNDFLNEMTATKPSPDMLSEEEKKNLDETKKALQSSDIDNSMNALAMQLTQVKTDL